MKINGNEYNEMINKLADEITEGFEVTASVGSKLNGVLSGRNVKESFNRFKGSKEYLKNKCVSDFQKGKQSKVVSSNRKAFAKDLAQAGGAYAGIGAGAGTGAALARNALKNKSQEDIAEKAAEVYEYAINKIAACEEMYLTGLAEQENCLEVLAEAGLMDENGLNKEAAESTDEAIEFTEVVAAEYEDALNKIAAAEECYSDAVEEANSAMEVLAELGYEI